MKAPGSLQFRIIAMIILSEMYFVIDGEGDEHAKPTFTVSRNGERLSTHDHVYPGDTLMPNWSGDWEVVIRWENIDSKVFETGNTFLVPVGLEVSSGFIFVDVYEADDVMPGRDITFLDF